MITIWLRLAAFAAVSLLSACQQKREHDTTAMPEPFWQAKPSIPFSPPEFCETAERLMIALPSSTNFRCQGGLEGALGARVDVSNVQIVLLQGAKSEWFMFAYELQSGAHSTVNDITLKELKDKFEQSLR